MGRPVNLYSFASVDNELAPNLRKYILDAQNEAFKRHDVFRIAVSGGSLPKTMAKALLAPSNGSPEDKVDFSKWEVFYADERCVPLTHEDSNHKLVKEEWLDKIPQDMAQPKVFPIDEGTLEDAQETADEYEKKLVNVFASRDSVKVPLFDLLLLGCGPDGHTCSLFPDHPLLRETEAWVLAINDSPKPPPKRITLSLPVVQAAAKIGFVATGGGKKDVLKQIFETEEGRNLPCGLVNGGAGEKVSWFCDTAATDGVSFPRRGSRSRTNRRVRRQKAINRYDANVVIYRSVTLSLRSRVPHAFTVCSDKYSYAQRTSKLPTSPANQRLHKTPAPLFADMIVRAYLARD
ncbi:6-phosphogluconolactonase [Hortaea werneckii]|nr:6-phosphogluconolactonase [Hortaea werneckii]